MARRMFSVPIALVTLVDSDRQWFKSRDGVTIPELPRNISFCGHAILKDEVMHVSDASLDDRFLDNPLVTGNPKIRFYAGYPLKVGSENLGTLCVIDDKPRTFSEEEVQLLKDLGEMAEQELCTLQQATTDLLTSLSNRRGFELLARHTLRICRRVNKSATLLFFDLDRLKWINDTYGHGEGDRALTTFAQGLLEVFRESDVIGRLGGDEFVVLLTGASSEIAMVAIERLNAWVSAHNSLLKEDCQIQFSVGQIQFDAARHRTIEDLVAEADAAMYANKNASRQQDNRP